VIDKEVCIEDVTFPAHLPPESFNSYGIKEFINCYLSYIENLSWEHIKHMEVLEGIKYPIDIDMIEADFRGKGIKYSDFRQVKGLRWEQSKKEVSFT
jgi:hypothetical protein